MPSNYQQAFPDFDQVIDFLPPEWIDTSWHNNTMPSWCLTLPNGQDITLWVNYASPYLREFTPVMPTDVFKMYTVVAEEFKGRTEHELFATDDRGELLEFLKTLGGDPL